MAGCGSPVAYSPLSVFTVSSLACLDTYLLGPRARARARTCVGIQEGDGRISFVEFEALHMFLTNIQASFEYFDKNKR